MSKIADQRAAFDAWYNDPARKTYVHNECSAYSGWLAAKADASEQPVAVPDGWKLVPTELTEAMMLAAQDVPAPRPYGAVYRAMLAAAPAAPAAQGDAKDLADKVASVLEGYAENYDMMARIGKTGDVDCKSVAHDIRRNMVDGIRAAIADKAVTS